MEAKILPSREILLGEVIYITLQYVFWIVSICWIFFQMWDKLHNRKK